jgi:hypothetical protein
MEVHKKKVTFYILPEELRNQDTYTRESIKQYEVSEGELRKRLRDPEQCFPTGHSTITCMCGTPPKPKDGKCEVFYTLGGKYCYTRCESCYIICNKK